MHTGCKTIKVVSFVKVHHHTFPNALQWNFKLYFRTRCSESCIQELWVSEKLFSLLYSICSTFTASNQLLLSWGGFLVFCGYYILLFSMEEPEYIGIASISICEGCSLEALCSNRLLCLLCVANHRIHGLLSEAAVQGCS